MTTYIKPTERILNCIPSSNIEQDWGVENAVEAGILSAAPLEIPSSVDLREDDWWEIADQKDHGACVGFATADILWWHLVKKGIFPQDKDRWLSRRFVWMAAKEMDEFTNYPTSFLEEPGTSLKAALDIIRKYGCVAETDLPFTPEKMSHLSQNSFYALASRLKITNYFTLRRPSDSWQVVAEKWQNWLATQGPILTRLGVDDTWFNANNTDGNLDVYQPETVRGGHAIAIVGYSADRLIIRNSWGTPWGDQGYAYASNAYAEAAFDEAYGISV
jgi:C1A family cysteine protease